MEPGRVNDEKGDNGLPTVEQLIELRRKYYQEYVDRNLEASKGTMVSQEAHMVSMTVEELAKQDLSRLQRIQETYKGTNIQLGEKDELVGWATGTPDHIRKYTTGKVAVGDHTVDMVEGKTFFIVPYKGSTSGYQAIILDRK